MRSCSGTGTPGEAWQTPHTHPLGRRGGEEINWQFITVHLHLHFISWHQYKKKDMSGIHYLSPWALQEYPAHLDSAPPSPDWESRSLGRTWGCRQPSAPRALNPPWPAGLSPTEPPSSVKDRMNTLVCTNSSLSVTHLSPFNRLIIVVHSLMINLCGNL